MHIFEYLCTVKYIFLMKKIFAVLFISFSYLSYAQGGLQFDELPFKELIAKAKKENKLLFIDAYAVWCGPCKMMEKNIFPKPSVGEVYNKNFINARIDMEKGEGKDIAQKYAVRAYPTYLFLNGDGELVSQNFGYMEEKAFIAMATDLSDPKNRKGSLKDRFAAGEKDREFLINIMRLNATTDFEFAKKASERYFENKNATEEITKDEIGFLLYFLKSSSDKNYKEYINRKTEIIKYLPEETYKEFQDQVILAKIVEESIDFKKKKINEDYFLSKAEPLVGKDLARQKLYQTKISYYEQNKDFAEYEKAALAYYNNAADFHASELLKAAHIFSENIKNINSLKKATEWAQQSVIAGQTSENTYILAQLLAKSGNAQQAKQYAETSRNIAKQTGKDSSLAEQLLQQLK